MEVLVLAPHPYYIDRGTPIDLDLLLRVLCSRPGTRVDLVVYPDGEPRDYPGLRIHRIPSTRLTRGTRPGFSGRKLVCDAFLTATALRLAARRRYDVVHAGEEAVFVARLLRWLFGVPYVYDLDSSIASQLVESRPALRPLAPVFRWLEARAIRGALATAPVCNALADLCRERGARKVVTLHDISQLEDPDAPPSGRLARETGSSRRFLLYAGNLEPYQGIDLLVEAFAIAARRTEGLDLAVVGGEAGDIARYRRRCEELGIGDRVHFLGPRPVALLGEYLADADVLVAPRIRGVNTPMKIFPYLHSGRPVLLTDLPTHTQVVGREVAMLAPPEPEAFADAIVRLAEDEALRRRLGRAGRAFVEAGHTFAAHARRVNELYDFVEAELAGRAA